LLLSALLVASLWTWYRTLGSADVEPISSPRAEFFYWLTIMFSQTLGTALGDWTADTAGLGYLGAAAIFGALLLWVILAHFWTRLSSTVLFWIAFVLTRPLGAVVGDFVESLLGNGDVARPDPRREFRTGRHILRRRSRPPLPARRAAQHGFRHVRFRQPPNSAT